MPRSPAPPLRPRLLMLPFCATLAGCAHQTAIAATEPAPSSVCAVWRPVLYSRLHDTDETIRQVKALNAAHDAVCGANPARSLP